MMHYKTNTTKHYME